MSVQLAINPEGLRFSLRVRVTPEIIETFGGVLGIFVASRIVLLALDYAGARFVEMSVGSTASPIKVIFSGWSYWDASGYLAVARNGYWFDPVLRQGTPIPLPLYPLLVGALSTNLPSVSAAGFLLSNLATAIAMVLLYRLVALRFGRRDVALRACLLFALYPFSFVFSAADARSLVLLGAVLALLAEACNRTWLAIAAVVIGSLAAPVGMVLWPALIVERITRWTRRGILASEAVSLVAGLALTGGALLWFQERLAALSFPTISPLTLLRGELEGSSLISPGLSSSGPEGTVFVVLTLIFAFLAILTLPDVARKVGVAAAAYVVSVVAFAIVWLLVVGQPADSGATLALAFPCLAVAADRLKRQAFSAIAFVSALLLAGTTFALILAAPAKPEEIAPARTFTETALKNFHVDFARQYPSGPSPRDLFLKVDDTFIILGDRLPSHRYEPGASISVPYYLYTLQVPQHGYLLSLRLQDANGNSVAQSDKVLWIGVDASLADPTVPSGLTPNRNLQETVVMTLNPNLTPGIYRLQSEVFAIPSFARLPLLTAANASVDHVSYADLVVARPDVLGTEQSIPIPRPLRADSNASLSLLGYDARRTNQGVEVSLYWKAEQKPTEDYTVFVQALDRAGRVIAQSDSYPDAGRFPTSRLDPGDVIRDVHVLTLATSSENRAIQLIAGLYRLDTMRRASFHRPGDVTTTDHVVLGNADWAASP